MKRAFLISFGLLLGAVWVGPSVTDYCECRSAVGCCFDGESFEVCPEGSVSYPEGELPGNSGGRAASRRRSLTGDYGNTWNSNAEDRDGVDAGVGIDLFPNDAFVGSVEVSHSFLRDDIDNTRVLVNLRYEF